MNSRPSTVPASTKHTPFRLWRMKHQAKLAARRGDWTTVIRIEAQGQKLLKRLEAERAQ